MSLLKSINKAADIKRRIFKEDGAVGATGTGDVAGTRGLLFSAPASMIKRFTGDMTTDYNQPKKQKKTKAPVKASVSEGLQLSAAFSALHEGGESEFDQTEVISRLKGLEDKEKADIRDTTVFGIEDDDQQVVRVTVRSDQATEFEKALQSIMAEFDEDENSKTEIAEILYKLKDHFDIVDVVWPAVQEDEEEGVDEFGNEQGAPGGDGLEGLEGEPGAEDGGDGLEGLEGDLGAEGGGEAEVQSLLTQVIDMMKADAEARKADAEARIADAKQREQEAGAKTALAKIKQEEQFLDMDDYTKKQKEQEKEAKRLAQLAKWKREMGGEGDTDAMADEGPDMGLPAKNGPVGGQGADYEEEERARYSNRVGQRSSGSVLRSGGNAVSAADLARRLLGGRK